MNFRAHILERKYTWSTRYRSISFDEAFCKLCRYSSALAEEDIDPQKESDFDVENVRGMIAKAAVPAPTKRMITATRKIVSETVRLSRTIGSLKARRSERYAEKAAAAANEAVALVSAERMLL